MFSSGSEDARGYGVTFYYIITEDTVKQCRDIENAHPSVRLLRDYIERAPAEDPEYRNRWKAMAWVHNMTELGLGSLVERYNGKPVLIFKSGTLISRENYFELDVNVHEFSYPARRGLHSLLEKFKDMHLAVGFVVEGRDDSELPEVMVGCADLYKLRHDEAVEMEV